MALDGAEGSKRGAVTAGRRFTHAG
jgi:hypothetical protein